MWDLFSQFSQFSCSVVSNSLRPHESQHARPPCPSPTPRVHSISCPSSWWCHPAISSSVTPFSSCPQSLPASGSFPISQLFAWGGQSIGVSALASVLPMKTQDWSPLGWTGWSSLQSKELSRVFSNTTVQKHQFFGGIPHSFNHCQVMLRTPSVLPHYAWMTAEGRNVMSLSTEGKRPQDLEGPRSDFRLLRSFWMWAKEYPVQRVIFQANSFWHAFW